MDSLTAFSLILGAMGLVGGAFVLIVVPRLEARDRKRNATALPSAE